MAFSYPICLAGCLLPSQRVCTSAVNICTFEKKNQTQNILGSFMLRNIVNIKGLSWQLAGCDEKLNKNIQIQNIVSDIISFQYFLERFYEDKTNFCGQLYVFILSQTGYRITQQKSFCLILPRPWQEQAYWLQFFSGAKNPVKWKQNAAPIYWVQWIIKK